MNILFTCAGRRNYLINYFKEALKGKGKVYALDMDSTAPSLIDADVAIESPSIYDERYISFLEDVIKKQDIGAVISLNDLELAILAEHKNILSKNTVVIISDKNAINIASDKWETVKFLNKIGLKSPKTFIDLDEAKKALQSGELNYPIVVKPRWGSGSIGVDFAFNEEELELVYKLQSKRISRTILSELSKEDITKAILIQEKIEGIEYGMDVLNTLEGDYHASFARQKLSMRYGETDKAVSVIKPELLKIGEIIGKNLKHIGNLDCDIFFDGTDYYVLELNPRFGGGYPFSHQAGINIPAIYLKWLEGSKDVEQFNNYREEISFSKFSSLMNVTKSL